MWKNLRQQGCDENIICVAAKEKAKLAAESTLAVCLLNYCFYRSVWAFFPLSLLGIFFYREQKRDLAKQKRAIAREQFKEMLILVIAGQRAGYSVENAFVNSYEDLMGLYGQNGAVCKMILDIKSGLRNHIPIAELWKTIAEKCQIGEIAEFAEVFRIAKTCGGNMVAIMQNTTEIIERKTETKKEIETFLSAGKFEQKIMNSMPFALMLYVEITSPGYFDAMYHNPTGIAIMSICFAIYLLAYLWGKHLAAIEV